MPEPRWVPDACRCLTPAEDLAIEHEIERRMAHLRKELGEAAGPYREAVEPDPRLRELTDAQLVVMALGERV